jgi:hypothetical protein
MNIEEQWFPIVLRTTNAIVWSVWVLQTARKDRPLIRLARQLVLPVILIGMWVYTFGSLTAIGVPGDLARTVYTVFTGFALVIGLSLVLGNTSTEKR